MKKLNLAQDSDTKLFEYLLFIPTNEAVSGKVNALKNTFSEVHGCKYASGLKPHLSMINFLQREVMEFRIINCFKKYSQYVHPFNVDLNGFGEFPAHTIYVNLSSDKTIVQLVKGIRSQYQRLLKISNLLKPHFITKPHLTIARGMTEEQHQAIWAIYEKETFHDSFTAKEMMLIKREIDPFTLKPLENYKVVHHFPFFGKKRAEQLTMAI